VAAEEVAVATPTPVEVVGELFRRLADGDDSAVDELVAPQMVNHAAGPQGQDGWKQILQVIATDLGATTTELHHLYGDGDLVTVHMTLHGTHQGSTMPLLTGTAPSGRPVAWTYIHICRVADGKVVEHWACRDDLGVLAQIGAWPK
jgi:lactoylglutathione lyase